MSEWLFPISPVAASRPRVSRHGAYFAGPYKKFRKDMSELVYEIIGHDFIPYDELIRVDLELFVTRPKTTKLVLPRSDIDNYIKSVYDSLNGKLWEDDSLIAVAYCSKQWAPKGTEGYFTVGVETCGELVE